MEVIRTREELREATDRARMDRRGVGFVPTMGYLHEGHRSLLARAREEQDLVVMSLFVNPLQFAPSEDLGAYPRDFERDSVMAGEEGVDVLFAPSGSEMYPGGEPSVTVDPGPLGDVLEGASRPAHFAGVCTVVAKLFSIVGPCTAYFGEKDAQQLAVIRRMVVDLDIPASIVGCPTVREPDGLALSSRNVYLSGEERVAARSLSAGLREAAGLVEAGERDANVVRAVMARRIGAEQLAQVEYVAVVDEETFSEVPVLERASRALVAARFGKARLIDTMLLPVLS